MNYSFRRRVADRAPLAGRRLYCDTAIVGTDSAVKPLLEMTDPATSYSGPTTGRRTERDRLNLAALSRDSSPHRDGAVRRGTNAIRVPPLRDRIPAAERTNTSDRAHPYGSAAAREKLRS